MNTALHAAEPVVPAGTLRHYGEAVPAVALQESRRWDGEAHWIGWPVPNMVLAKGHRTDRPCQYGDSIKCCPPSGRDGWQPGEKDAVIPRFA